MSSQTKSSRIYFKTETKTKTQQKKECQTPWHSIYFYPNYSRKTTDSRESSYVRKKKTFTKSYRISISGCHIGKINLHKDVIFVRGKEEIAKADEARQFDKNARHLKINNYTIAQ